MTASSSTLPATKNSIESRPVNSQGRLMSLDLFRGATIAAMILVNDPGIEDAAFGPLRHSQWNGWTPTDLVFPFFIFIVGVSLVFSFAARRKRGDSNFKLLRHTIQRGAIIFAIGLGLNAILLIFLPAYYHSVRIPGVLQRIGVVYLIAAILYLYVGIRGRIVIGVLLLLGYWVLMRFVPVPGYGMPGRDVAFLHPDGNLAAYLDRLLMSGHLYEGTRDPEGLLSTLPAIATALAGIFTGEWLRTANRPKKKALVMFLFGAAGLLLGKLWNPWFPINKKLWTSSYVLFSAGFALVILAICYWVNDVKQRRGAWTKPFLIFGMNAITAYVIAWLMEVAEAAITVHAGGKEISLQELITRRLFASISNPAMASLIFALSFVIVSFLPVWWMYRKRVFLKV